MAQFDLHFQMHYRDCMAASPPPDSTREPSFEDSFQEVDRIVAQLEAGDKPLDETLALYEKAVAALRRCHTVLDGAEKRILLLRSANGQPVLQDTGNASLPSGHEESSTEEPREAPASASPRTRPGTPPPAAAGHGGQGRPPHPAAQNSLRQSVDSTPPGGENTAPSENFKPRPAHAPLRKERSPGGGSLFGGPQ